jgi:hypothetical protein
MARTEYDPKRQQNPIDSDDPIEVALVFNVRPCGTCDFFWPGNPADQPYGPFPMFDFQSNTPEGNSPKQESTAYPWMKISTREPSFPNGEVMDGCRKAPIMTLGINPNLTAFSPGTMGTAWAYPAFTSDSGTDAWAKYAYYYRYRSVYQERFSLDVIKDYLLKQGQIIAERDGHIVAANRPSSDPSYPLTVHYDKDKEDTIIPLQRKLGEPRYVLLFNRDEPGNTFKKGDVIAGKLDVPAGENLTLWQEQIGYYEQFVPTLDSFSEFMKRKGHPDANLRIGEDVCQLDMVACASPHWNPNFLGGSKESEQTIINNCVSTNAWAMKQLVQTQPAVLYLVGESSFNMFRRAFGKLIHRDPPLPSHPADNAFTLFRDTCDSAHPTTFAFAATIDDRPFSINTRLIATPHFSYDSNFVPQIRLSKGWWDELQKADPECAKFLTTDPRIRYVVPDYGYYAFEITSDVDGVLREISSKFPASANELMDSYYDPHSMMAEVMEDLYEQGVLSYQPAADGKPGFLQRTEGACRFCVNDHWRFPLGCPYGKTELESLPRGFLDRVAAQIIQAGKGWPS